MGEGKGKKQLQRGREANHKRLLNTENKLRVDEGVEERERWLMGIEEGPCWDEHWVLYVNDEPWESTPPNQEHTVHTVC